MPVKISCSVVNKGPPATTSSPASVQQAVIWRADVRWTVMALMNAQSAQVRSSEASFRVLTSTNRLGHSGGSIEATVSNPSGGDEAFLRMKRSACLKLQNVSGNSGYIR